MAFSLFHRLFSKYKTEQKYQFHFRVSFPLSDGLYRETGVIKIDIPANNPEQAKRKLNRYVMKKVKTVVVSVAEKEQENPIYSKVKTKNPRHN